MKNPDKSYIDIKTLKERIIYDIQTIFSISIDSLDQTNFFNILDFYLGLSDNTSYYIYSEITNFLNDMKKHSLLLDILNIIISKIKSK